MAQPVPPRPPRRIFPEPIGRRVTAPKIQVLGGGDPPLNAAGKAAYEMNQTGLKDGSIVDKARQVCVPDGVPRVLATPYPFEVFQVPAGQVTFRL